MIITEKYVLTSSFLYASENFFDDEVVVKVEVYTEEDDEYSHNHFNVGAVVMSYTVTPEGEASCTC